MPNHTSADEDLRRLEEERDAAHQLYGEALTALDEAVRSIATSLDPPPEVDARTLEASTRLAAILPADPLAGFAGWRARAAGFIWRLVGPWMQQQQAFNATLLEQVSLRAARNREAFERLNGILAALHQLHGALILYAQQITAYVDTKDRAACGAERRCTIGLAEAISGVADEAAKRWESMVAREQRYEARAAGLDGAVDELRAGVTSVQQATHVLKRELERWRQAAPTGTGVVAVPPETPGRAPSVTIGANPLEAHRYAAFEDQFRGKPGDIRSRLEGYIGYFEGAVDVLDVGCGRGEFLDLLRERGIAASGIDVNHEMVERCRARGLRVEEGDAVQYLAGLADLSLGGLFAAQVVEHLEPDHLLRLLDLASTRLRPGAWIVLETVNVACWSAFFDSYMRDLTHVRAVHPETLKYLLQACGLVDVEIVYRSPFPAQDRLQEVALPLFGETPTSAETSLLDVAEQFNANVERLNARLFTSLDYAAVGRRR